MSFIFDTFSAGTLTEEGLDILGFRFVVPSEKNSQSVSFSRLYRSLRSRKSESFCREPAVERAKSLACSIPNPLHFSPDLLDFPSADLDTAKEEFPYPLIICGMASCHSLKIVGGEIIGDPLDIQMFQFTGWEMEDKGASGAGAPGTPSRKTSLSGMIGTVVRPPGSQEMETLWRDSLGFVVSPDTSLSSQDLLQKHTMNETGIELGVVRLFDFVSGLRRMSVVVSRVKNEQSRNVYSDLNSASSSSGKEFEVVCDPVAFFNLVS